jgi:hypothetical protein
VLQYEDSQRIAGLQSTRNPEVSTSYSVRGEETGVISLAPSGWPSGLPPQTEPTNEKGGLGNLEAGPLIFRKR